MQCPDHPEERLRFVCLPCDELVCRDCKLTDHEGHRSVDFTKATAGLGDKLAEHRCRLEGRRSLLRAVQEELEADKTAASLRQQALESCVRNRVALVTLWLREAEIAALNSLKTASLQVDNAQDTASSEVAGRLREVDTMIATVDSTISSIDQPTFDPVAALRVERDMRTGCGKGENLEKLTEGLPLHSVKPAVLSELSSVNSAMMARFIGTALCTQVSKAAPKVALSLLFRCTDVSGACVNAVCPLPGGRVWIAHDVREGDSGEQRVCLYSADGQCLSEQKHSGKASLARVFHNWVFVVGGEPKKLLINGQETRLETHQGDAKYSPVALSKLNLRFSLEKADRRDEVVICKMEVRSVLSLTTAREPFFSVYATLPQALDADSSGRYFALLILKPPSVHLYSPFNPKPLSVYRPRIDSFSPSDVCFHFLEGGERLLVADWFNSAVHVLSYTNGLRFQSFLGEGCPLVHQPTALSSDDENRLWIGCKGGQVVLCAAADCFPSDLSQGREEELGDGSKACDSGQWTV